MVHATAAFTASPPADPLPPAPPAPPVPAAPADPPAPPAPIMFPLLVIVIVPAPPESTSKPYSAVLLDPSVIPDGITTFFG